MKIGEKEVTELIMTGIACGHDRDVLDFGVTTHLRRPNVIEIRPIDPSTNEPRRGEIFRVIVEKLMGVQSKTIRIIGFPSRFNLRINLIRLIRDACGLDLMASRAIIDKPLPIYIECLNYEEAEKLRGILREMKLVLE